MFEKAMDLIRAYDRIIIHRHKSPDGDALGSQIGLAYLIKGTYPDKEVLMVGDMTKRYAFMTHADEMADVPDEAYKGALAIVLDTSAKSLICDDRYTTADATLRIDHHIFVETICDEEITDTSFESCCGLITALSMESELAMNLDAATALYTGMVTDSGRFRFDSTTAATFQRAAYLMEQPIDTVELFRGLYTDDFETIKNRAAFVLKIAFTEHRVAYIYTTRDEAAATGLDTFAISRGMVGTMGEIRGTDIWVNFTEAESGVLCEIRSSKYNINPIAVKYGGGGHAKASGATVPDRATAMQMLSDLDYMSEHGGEVR